MHKSTIDDDPNPSRIQLNIQKDQSVKIEKQLMADEQLAIPWVQG